MQGHCKQVVAAQTRFMEFMSIEPTPDGGLNLWILLGAPSKGRKMGVPFRLQEMTADSAIWSNPANPFPSTIAYRKTSQGIHCQIAGHQAGQEKTMDFWFEQM